MTIRAITAKSFFENVDQSKPIKICIFDTCDGTARIETVKEDGVILKLIDYSMLYPGTELPTDKLFVRFDDFYYLHGITKNDESVIFENEQE